MTGTTQQTRRFAYGEKENEEAMCPAMAVGLDPREGHALDVVGVYDEICRERFPWADEGTISEADARDAWLEAIRREEDVRDEVDPSHNGDWTDLEQAKTIAEELGWDGEVN